MQNSLNEAPIDIPTFWRAVGVRAVGAAVVAARDADGPAGFLALSATHLCASPPMMMVSIGLKTSALSTIRNSGAFSINYLGVEDREMADSFGGKGNFKGADRFEAGRWETLVTGAPTLVGAAGVLDCVLDEMIERHATVITLGRLVGFSSDAERQPLISFAGRMG